MNTANKERLYQIVGVAAPQAVILLWLSFLFFNPYAEPPSDETRRVGGAMMLLAGFGSLAAFVMRPVWMYVVFGLSLLPIGGYLAGTPGVYRWIGILYLVYLGAAIGLHRSQRASQRGGTPR